jgi:hypothetical protein
MLHVDTSTEKTGVIIGWAGKRRKHIACRLLASSSTITICASTGGGTTWRGRRGRRRFRKRGKRGRIRGRGFAFRLRTSSPKLTSDGTTLRRRLTRTTGRRIRGDDRRVLTPGRWRCGNFWLGGKWLHSKWLQTNLLGQHAPLFHDPPPPPALSAASPAPSERLCQ